MSDEIDVDALLESLGDMTYDQARQFAASLGVEIGAKQPKQETPKQAQVPDATSVQAQFASEKYELSRRHRGGSFIDQLNSLRNRYRRQYPGVEFDGIAAPVTAKPEPEQAPPELSKSEEADLRAKYRAEMRQFPSSAVPQRFEIQRKYRRLGLKI